MKNKLLKFLFGLIRTTDYLPSRAEVKYLLVNVDYRFAPQRIRQAMIGYLYYQSLESLAYSFECTRERIRQLILKGARDGWAILLQSKQEYKQ